MDCECTPHDKSNGYEEVAERFMVSRNPRIGVSTVREWSRALACGSSVLDVGCGHGVPISQARSGPVLGSSPSAVNGRERDSPKSLYFFIVLFGKLDCVSGETLEGSQLRDDPSRNLSATLISHDNRGTNQ
jgi:hypothetical protein